MHNGNRSPETPLRVHDVIARALSTDAVTTVFGLVGGGNYAFVSALSSRYGIRFVPARHEASAASAADVYARLSGRVGVCTLTQGPGFTHAMTALVEAVKSRTALVVLAGDMRSPSGMANQDIDQAGLAAAAGAHVRCVDEPATAEVDIREALALARDSQRPVVVNLPIEIQSQLAPTAPIEAALNSHAVATEPDAAAIRHTTRMLASARQPLILAGRGAVRSGAGPALRSLAAELGALLCTTVMARGLFAGDPFDLDVCGGFSDATAADLIADADVVLAVGAGLNAWTTRHGELLKRAAVIQIDHDSAAIGALHTVDLGIVADAASATAAIREQLTRLPGHGGGYRTQRVVDVLRARRSARFQDASVPGEIDPRTCMVELNRILPPSRCVTVDGGHHSGFPAMHLSAPDATSFVYAHGFQSVGLGLGNAIGAAVALPDRLTVAVIGDGGLLMTLGELDALRALHQPVLVVILNDAAYGAELHHFGPLGLPEHLARLTPVDFAAVARALGAEAITVTEATHLDSLVPWLAQPSGLMVVDCKVNPRVTADWLRHAFPVSR